MPPYLRVLDIHKAQKPEFSRVNSRVNMGCALAIVFQVRSICVPTKNRSPSRGHFWESLVF